MRYNPFFLRDPELSKLSSKSYAIDPSIIPQGVSKQLKGKYVEYNQVILAFDSTSFVILDQSQESLKEVKKARFKGTEFKKIKLGNEVKFDKLNSFVIISTASFLFSFPPKPWKLQVISLLDRNEFSTSLTVSIIDI